MYSNRVKSLSYMVIFIGIIFLFVGLLSFILQGYKSNTPSYVIMTLASIRITFPIVGVSLILLGNLFLHIIDEYRNEIQSLKNEQSKILKIIRKE
ncbi:hypothetical protein [Paenibacillus marinisediminis]